jgi:lipopolysaccharide export system permease protein
MNAAIGTVSRYFAWRFLKAALGFYAGCLLLIFLIDFVEMLRRGEGNEDIGLGVLFQMAAYRAPTFAEQAMPFAILLGTMATLLALSRRNELVIARAAGLSAWQFLAPACLVAFLFGTVAVTIYNPLATYLREEQARIEAETFGASKSLIARSSSGGVWLRQEGVDGQTVMHATRGRQKGVILDNVTVQVFNAEGQFVERVQAKTAELHDDHWELKEAWTLSEEGEPQYFGNYLISTFLTRTQIQESIADPESISFWDLPSFIDHARRAGLSTTPYQLQFQQLISRPFILAAMVLIAAVVSMRPFRFGSIGRMVVLGVAAGFLFFVFTKIMSSLGAADMLSPAAATWLPVIVVMLAGLTILLYQEDG